MEEINQINELVKPYADRLAESSLTEATLKMLAIDCYKAGMDRSKKIYKENL